ncbi:MULTISPECIES: TetR family transcriptional regulator [unclassified Plantibacter]|uniref:TetR family transcriptional regulator n=1 Tax=unclassified Plantibacter TaxID=2624265 RepID=UPI0009E881E0|nr:MULTISPECIES: TetR family transcriptional regulator [unclassified Plantibacter]
MTESTPIPVRERARRAMRAELAMLAQDLFAAKGYEQTTIDDLVAAAGISRRTFFRYFTSKEDLMLGKYDAWSQMLGEALAARPAEEPIWESLRRSFDVVVEHFEDATLAERALAIELIIHDNPALSAGELERISRVQGDLAELVGERIGHRPGTDPRATVIAGAALTCVVAAKDLWMTTDRGRPFGVLLDEAMGSLKPI